jgi:hypothetical protein
MEILRWLIGSLFLAFASVVIAHNWLVFWNRHILKKQAPSWIPLLGGVAGAVGVAVLPVDWSLRYCLAPLLLDWGSAPGLLYSVVWYLLYRKSLED